MKEEIGEGSKGIKNSFRAYARASSADTFSSSTPEDFQS
jgi:hypothetical protein